MMFLTTDEQVKACLGGAGDRTTDDPPEAAERTEMCEGCKGELAHPLGCGASHNQR